MLAKKKTHSIYDTAFMAWFICLLAAVFYAYDFLLRVQPNILVRELLNFYGTNAAGVGILYSAYYWAYTPLQIPAGLVVDHFSTRIVLTISALLCAIGALLFAGVQSFSIALIARVLMGVGSAFAFIGSLKLAAIWLPERHFGKFSGIATALGTIGALATNAILPVWVSSFGWQQMVLLTGYIGIGVTILLGLIIRTKPRRMAALPHEFRSWKHAFSRLWFISKQFDFWINGLVGCFTFLPITVLAGLWGTSFLIKAYNMTPQHAAAADAIIFIGMAVGGPIAGWVSDHMKRRKIPIYFGSLISAILLLALIYENNISRVSLYGVLFFLGFFSGPQVLVFAIGKEISPPRTTGTSAAFTNFLVTNGGLTFAPLVGFLMVRLWTGELTPQGAPLYTLHTFKTALLVMPCASVLAFILLLFVPETYGKMKFKSLRRKYY